MIWHEGDTVAWWNGHDLDVAVAAGEEKRRIRLILPGGKETRVAPGRLAFVIERGPGGPGRDADACRRAAERTVAAAERIRALAGTVDIEVLWELVGGAETALGVDALTQLAFDADGGYERAALVRAFLDDGVHFTRKGECWDPRDAVTIERLRHERAVAVRREAERRDALDAFAALGRGQAVEPSSHPGLAKYLDALEEQALRDLDVSDGVRALAADALTASGIAFERPAEGAFRLLRRLGRWSDDDANLQLDRFGLSTAFPDELVEHARRRASERFEREGRENFTALEVLTIDSPCTSEIDDGVSLERLDRGESRLGVHIADPGTFVEVGDAVDAEAARRGATVYFPDVKVPMLPSSLSEDAASLREGQDRPAISFLADLSSDGRIVRTRIVRSIVRVSRRLTYADVDARLAHGDAPDPLRGLDELARARESARLADGAVVLHSEEIDVHVGTTGEPRLERLAADSAAKRIVTESMIAVGAIAAARAVEADVPFLFRRQSAPDGSEDAGRRIVEDPIAARRVRMRLRRGDTGLEPGAHFALGLPAYAQVTSPLRRFQDLVNQRQLVAWLEERPLPYGRDDLQRIAALTERVEIEGRRAEREADRYWKLRYLERFVGSEMDGLVLDRIPRAVVRLTEVGLEQPVTGLDGVEPGDRVRVRVVHVNPRADVVKLRRSDPLAENAV